MRVLVGMECSGAVRQAFRNLGHEAWSCDLKPAEDGSPYHLQRDVRDVLAPAWAWDAAVFFPDCTYLASSGMHWTTRGLRPQSLTDDALAMVRLLMDAPIPRIAIENPIGRISTAIRKPDQIIQPWMFGHPESKATCLWLKGLPPLQPTNVLLLPPTGKWANQTPSGQNKLGPSPRRAADRARTYSGVAAAMAAQWGGSTTGE